MRFRYLSACSTAALTIVTFLISVMTVPLSGPMCVGNCFTYPFDGIASRFPRDYYWMVIAIIQVVSYLILLVNIHDYATLQKKVWSLLGVCFGTISAGTLILTYFIQLVVIQPSLLHGESDGIPLLTQFNPHGLFIALEEIGYILMAISFFFIGLVFSEDGRLGKTARWIFQFGFFVVIALLLFYLFAYGHEREYRFEIAVISVDWLVLTIASILLAKIFKPPTTRETN